MTPAGAKRRLLALTGFGLVLALAAFCYRPALHGDFRLDDRANLGGLTAVADGAPALDFVLAGDAGPTGRPLALATFALQADSWAEGPGAFLFVNILIHLANAILLALCCYRLALAARNEPDRALYAATAAAAVWVLLPLNATATLLVVQRMTTLSATFVLLGLAGYLVARARLARRPGPALAGMSASLVAGTLFAALAKESGLLLPVFALVLEATVLGRPTGLARRTWRLWQGAFLWLPLAVLLYYLATQLSYSEALALKRGFGPLERLMTEARVLWLYVERALVGLPWRLGIYQTPPVVSRSLFEPATLAAVLGWLALGGAAVVLRRREPYFALAVLWFLAAHLVESTVVPLELYFEHRNYLAFAIPLFTIACAVVAGPPVLRRAGAAALAVVLIGNAFFLYTFASIWGEPSTSSRYWALRYPDSVRAVTTMASYQLTEEGPLRTLETIDRFARQQPAHAYLRIQELNLRCRIAPGADHSAVVAALNAGLPGVDFTYTAGRMLSELLDTVAARECSGVGPATVAMLAGRLRENPRYARDRLYNQFHFRLRASIARLGGDLPAALDYLRRAMEYAPSSELNQMYVTAVAGAGDFDAARDFIDDAREQGPGNVVRWLRWQRDLDSLEAYVLALEQAAGENPSAPAPEQKESE
ncbi:MAG: hypothetical protein R3176_01065 [Woeseiaceae bacterium]|nr:hypothetical protein [Woeseiaceae bacterium]